MPQIGGPWGGRGGRGAGQRDVSEQRVSLELLDHGGDAVVSPDPQVVALRDVVGEDDPRVLTHSRKHGEQHIALERLCLVDDHERVVQRAPANVRQRQHLEQLAVHDLLDDLARDHRAERVEDGLRPGPHLLVLGTWQVAELLAADGVQRTEHDHLAVLATLHDGFESGAQGQCRLSGAGASAEADDADVGVEQQVERDALFGRPTVQAERVPIASDETNALVGHDAPERAAARPEHDHACVARQFGGDGRFEAGLVVQGVHLLGGDVEFADAGPSAVRSELRAVLLGVESNRGRLHAHREVLADDRHLAPLVRQVAGDRQDAGVVVSQAKSGRQRVRIGVIELDAQGAAVTDRHRRVQAAVLDAQVVEHAQRGAGEVAEFRVMPFAFELTDHHDREHHFVFGEARHRAWIRQEHRRIEHVRAGAVQFNGHADSSCARSLAATRGWCAGCRPE